MFRGVEQPERESVEKGRARNSGEDIGEGDRVVGGRRPGFRGPGKMASVIRTRRLARRENERGERERDSFFGNSRLGESFGARTGNSCADNLRKSVVERVARGLCRSRNSGAGYIERDIFEDTFARPEQFALWVEKDGIVICLGIHCFHERKKIIFWCV